MSTMPSVDNEGTIIFKEVRSMSRKSMIRAIMKMLEEMEESRVRAVWFFVKGLKQ